MKIETDNLIPVFLRDLNPEIRTQHTADIEANPKLKAAAERGDDIIVGWFARKWATPYDLYRQSGTGENAGPKPPDPHRAPGPNPGPPGDGLEAAMTQ